jgi:6-phosphogluconolactonase (cycloisomerase 2 family)
LPVALFPLCAFAAQETPVAGAVYTMSNATDGNSVLVFDRLASGALVPAGEYPTGGLGTGGGLGNQGAVVLTEDERFLFVVNPASGDVSVFAVSRGGLVLVDVEDSAGEQPVSLTVDRDLLYVLNAGSDSIAGFTVANDGKLSPLPGSIQPLSGAGTGPAQIQFSPDGRVLVVTEKNTNRILTYAVGSNGLPGAPQVFDSSGTTPFGFAFGKRGQVLVSEAEGGAPDAGTVSSYEVERDGALELIDPSVPTNQTAICWLVVTPSGRFAFGTNTGSDSISGFAIDHDGHLTLLEPDGRNGVTGDGSAPIDMALDRSGRYLYTLNTGTNSLSVFRLGPRGELFPLPGLSGLPAGANGLAAR